MKHNLICHNCDQPVLYLKNDDFLSCYARCTILMLKNNEITNYWLISYNSSKELIGVSSSNENGTIVYLDHKILFKSSQIIHFPIVNNVIEIITFINRLYNLTAFQ